MKIFQLIVLSTSLLISAASFAHSGHDHSSSFSNLIHLLWLTPALIALAVVCSSKLLKKNHKMKATKPQSNNT